MARNYRLGVIGAGNMGSALVRGIVRAGAVPPQQVIVADPEPGRADALARDLGVATAAGNRQAAEGSLYVVLAVKPGVVGPVLAEIAPVLEPDQTVVSIAAGVPLSRLRGALGSSSAALIRVMPNTPALVGAGAFGLSAPGVPPERTQELVQMLGAVGLVVEVDESQMDAVTGLSGSGPAFVFLLIEAMADGGVAAGLPRGTAQALAAQTVLGAAKMILETGQHPGALKDAVASPGGTTIAGLAELERGRFRSTVLSAVQAAAARARELARASQ